MRRALGSGRLRSVATRLAVAVTLVAAGCSSVDVPEPLPGPEPLGEPVPPDDLGQVDQEGSDGGGGCLGSYRPRGPATADVPPSSHMARIRQREPAVLRVGVDVGTPQFSSINPRTGEPEGFDVDIAREVAGALLGDRDAVELVGMTSAERSDALLDGRVDLVVHNYTITCDRWEKIAFSTEYFTAYQRILVPRSSAAESLEDLRGRRVCATRRSTVMDRIGRMEEPRPLPVAVGERAECLMLLQQGQVDALATDDAILVGMAAQDPNLRLGSAQFSVEHYGIGLPPDRPEWVRYVNAVLEDVRASGRWRELYDEWLVESLGDVDDHGPDPEPPEPEYRD